MGWRIRLIDGDEYDAITAWRHYRHWRPGRRARMKRAIRRRARHEASRLVRPAH